MSGKQAKRRRRGSSGQDWSALDVRMLQDDTAWVSALTMSCATSPEWESPMGLALLPQISRIAFEGMDLLHRQRPAQAAGFKRRYPDEVEAARHTVKLFDDTSKGLQGVIADFEQIAIEHDAVFAGGPTLAVATVAGRVCVSSRVTGFQFRRALEDIDVTDREESVTYDYAVDIGATLRVLLEQFGKVVPAARLHGPPNEPAPRFQDVDRLTYLQDRFPRDLSLAAKDAVLFVEAAVNAALFLFADSSAEYREPVFRTRVVTAMHAMNALAVLRKKYGARTTQLDQALTSSSARALGARSALRNRCMHYGVPASFAGVGAELPGYGLVEATSDGDSFQTAEAEVLQVLQDLSNAPHGWAPAS